MIRINLMLILLLSVLSIYSGATEIPDTSVVSNSDKVVMERVYSFPTILPNEQILVKEILRNNKEFIFLSNSKYVKSFKDLDSLKSAEKQALANKYPKFSSQVISIYEKMGENELCSVSVEFNDDLSSNKIKKQFKFSERNIGNKKKTVGAMSKKQLKSLMSNNNIKKIKFHYTPKPLTGGDENCGDCDPGFYTEQDFPDAFFNFPEGENQMPSFGKGAGVIAATVESAINEQYLTELKTYPEHSTINESFIELTSITNRYVEHANMTFHCLANTAPFAILKHTENMQINNLTSMGIEVASQSLESPGDNESYSIIDTATYMESKAIVFTNPAANNGICYGAHWPMYNGINVGGNTKINNEYYDVVLDTWGTKKSDNTWKKGTNPVLTQATNEDGDRELPHIVGPTHGFCGNSIVDPVAKDLGVKSSFGGTSAAAPSVNGIAACVIGASDLMRSNPENVKVALMVTAENVHGGYWDPNVDGIDGCGQVSGYSAVEYANSLENSKQHPESYATTDGLGFDKIYRDSPPPGNKIRYNIASTFSDIENKHFRAVLTWSSSISKNESEIDRNRISNLNLNLIEKSTGRIIDYCRSINDNVEVIDVDFDKFRSGEEYCLEIDIVNLNFPPNPTRDYIKYSLGWTKVNDGAYKKVKNANINYHTNEYDLMNNTIGFQDNVTFYAGSYADISAGEKIVLNPGTTIKEGATIKTNLAKNIIRYDFLYDKDDITSTRPYESASKYQNLTHNSANLVLVSNEKAYSDADRFLQTYHALTYNDNRISYEMIDLPQEFKDCLKSGITMSFWVRFFDSHSCNGIIFKGIDELGNGLEISAEDHSPNKSVRLVIQDENGNVNTINYPIYPEDMMIENGHLGHTGWVHLTFMWKSEEFLKLYVNGEETPQTVNSNIKEIPLAPNYYLGGQPGGAGESFIGSIDEISIYNGILSSKNILSKYHGISFPFYNGEYKDFNIEINGDGYVKYTTLFKGNNYNDFQTLIVNSNQNIRIPKDWINSIEIVANAGSKFKNSEYFLGSSPNSTNPFLFKTKKEFYERGYESYKLVLNFEPDARTCSYDSWSSSAVYTGGTTVEHNGVLWYAKWWTQGEEPGTTGEWGVWENHGECNN